MVPPEAQVCSICGSKDFSEEWSGMVVVLDPERSAVAKLLGITRPGKYALKVGV